MVLKIAITISVASIAVMIYSLPEVEKVSTLIHIWRMLFSAVIYTILRVIAKRWPIDPGLIVQTMIDAA